jgi:ferredoxin
MRKGPTGNAAGAVTSRAFDPARSRLSCQIKVTESLAGLRLVVAPDDT